jgi:hypothetical protein
MPMHDWTRVLPGIFHHFHHDWITAIAGSLNDSLLPGDYYALAEQVAEGPIPDVLTLERVDEDSGPVSSGAASGETGGLALAECPPRVQYTLEGEQKIYANKVNRVTVYHASGDRVVAYIEIVSPGNKQSEREVQRFLEKLADAIERGCHLLIVDPHPPTPRDPHGLHYRFWSDHFVQDDSPGVTAETPLSLAAYRSSIVPSAYFQPIAVGAVLPDMPLFITQDRYINVPLEATYMAAWKGVPRRWKTVIEGGA